MLNLASQSIIVYNNPAEEWLWESGALAWIILIVLAAMVVSYFISWVDQRFR